MLKLLHWKNFNDFCIKIYMIIIKFANRTTQQFQKRNEHK